MRVKSGHDPVFIFKPGSKYPGFFCLIINITVAERISAGFVEQKRGSGFLIQPAGLVVGIR